MAAPRQGLPVRLERAPHRGAAFALSNASKRARTRVDWLAFKGLVVHFFDHPPPSLPLAPVTVSPATTACRLPCHPTGALVTTTIGRTGPRRFRITQH